jgi:plastocyanin
MRRALVAVVTPCLALAAAAALASTADVTVTSLPANTFIPQVVTIRVGDSVRWTNTDGIHNVFSDDGFSFTSGSPAAAPWTYTYVFTTAGTFGYHCQPHGSPGTGQSGTIVVLPAVELAHGSDLVEDLAGAPDLYRIGQKPYSSYEVVVDPAAGDPTLQVDRLDATGTVLIQAGQAVTATIDMVQSLRWENATASPVDADRVRVGGATCPGACSANDVYRVRAYETTLAMPRYNNSGTQVSVVVLQNPTDYAITGHVYFWNTAGSLVNGTGTSFSLLPKRAGIISGAGVPGVPGTSGTVTVSHDGRYGDLAGKVVALEPATGFSFDTPGVVRPR